MPAKAKSDATEALKQLTYLASALKAPRNTEAAARLADHARGAGWTHEEYLAAALDPTTATGSYLPPRPSGSPGSPTPTAPAGSPKSSPGCAATG